jgi:hypothetical protein
MKIDATASRQAAIVPPAMKAIQRINWPLLRFKLWIEMAHGPVRRPARREPQTGLEVAGPIGMGGIASRFLPTADCI